MKKQPLDALKKIATKYEIFEENNSKNSCGGGLTKKQIITKFQEYINNNVLETIEYKKSNEVNMIFLCYNIKKIFDEIFKDIIQSIKVVCIENQITSRMRILSFVIAEYFIAKNDNICVDMISPIFKLKNFSNEYLKTDENKDVIDDINTECYNNEDDDKEKQDKIIKIMKNDYKTRKKNAVLFCSQIIKEKYSSWLSFFEKNKKKDDLSDCFLQGIWYINNKYYN